MDCKWRQNSYQALFIRKQHRTENLTSNSENKIVFVDIVPWFYVQLFHAIIACNTLQ